ncbi:MAG: cytidine deaminase [Chloroflexi bacterium]|nr:cytidine deaminase [Chloroflexota bacterium]
MQTLPITKKDQELIEAARGIISKYYRENWNEIGVALLTKSGKTYTAVNIDAYIGRIAVCAEAIVIGKAISDGEREFDTIVAVKHPHPGEIDRKIKVASPCGMCRELISDYGRGIEVIFTEQDKIKKCRVMELLPAKYV